MRRSEFEIDDKDTILKLLSECEYGTLSLLDHDGLPYGIPLNFAWWQEGVVFHGSTEGEKMDFIAKNPVASFNALKSYAFIPSYFSNTRSACPATQFFGSVTLRGKIRMLEDANEKALALNALMEKLQPEKRYETIEASNPIYTAMLAKTAVMHLVPKSLTCKLKIGQNLSQSQRDNLIKHLFTRGKKKDNQTMTLMKEFHDAKTF